MSTTNQEILSKMADQFMQPSITRKLDWVELDGTHGSTFVSLEDVGKYETDSEDEDANAEAELAHYAAYYEGKIESINYVSGFGARLSAPGYMDCTDWTVFSTRQEAEQYLVDTYGDDIDTNDEEEAV